MHIIRTFVPNSARNYNHLVFCSHTQQAAAVDPYDAQHLINIARTHQLTIKQIWITHEHGDHIRDLSKLKALTGASIYAPKTCKGLFEADIWLEDNVAIALGEGLVRHWLSPGHTPGHGVYVYQSDSAPEEDFIVCGDTLFNAGVGNTYSGDTIQLFHTVSALVRRLSATTRLFPGHDYLLTNLKFVHHHFPACEAAVQTLAEVADQTPDTRSVQTLADEQRFNPFLSLHAPWLTNHDHFTGLDEQQTFVALRKLRDQWQ